MKIVLEYQDAAVRRALDNLTRAGGDLTPAMREIAQLLESSAREAFFQAHFQGIFRSQ